jgi:hypothetical protein
MDDMHGKDQDKKLHQQGDGVFGHEEELVNDLALCPSETGNEV